MGRLIDEEELEKYIIHDGCDKGCGYIDERDLKCIPTVEAIPKDQYEARLKADMVAMLTELQLECEENKTRCYDWRHDGKTVDAVLMETINELIQQKINKLRGEKDETDKRNK